MADALKQETGFTENTKVADKNGNVFTVPSGFKIVPNGQDEVVYNKDAEHNPTVQDGIVIEDVSAGGAGNQFVWIPVGTLKKENEETDTTIALERRIFGDGGTVTEHTAEGTALNTYYIEQTLSDHEAKSYGNAIAKDIAEFKQSVSTNGGYYLARFEASKGSTNTEVKSVKGADPWVNITQSVASTNCQNMYVYDSSTKKYQSDLVNSYAWDTAIYFIQECSTEDAYATRRMNESLTKTGANNDGPCNICDMAGNVLEWLTETSTISLNPTVNQGGDFALHRYQASAREWRNEDCSNEYIGFRAVLYIK